MTAMAHIDRMLPPACGVNFRDFGGYPTAGGGMVRRGLLYRSGVMTHVADAGRDRLAALGIVAICDLRSTPERARQPTNWHETPGRDDGSVHYWSRSYAHTIADLEATAREDRDAASVRRLMLGLYRTIASDHAESFRALFAMLLAGRVPLLVNCSAGKDRTGTAVALILSALDVPRAVIVEDYLLTGQADLSRLRMGSRWTDEMLVPLLAADPAYLDALFAAIEASDGSVDAFLADRLGVGAAERARLRALLVDG